MNKLNSSLALVKIRNRMFGLALTTGDGVGGGGGTVHCKFTAYTI